jgi:serine/threonine protein phosphatase 1
MITIAVGDVHGCLEELKQLIASLSQYHNRDDVRWVFLGDYVDRGPDVRGVVNFLMEFSQTNNCVFLKGNHEDMMLDPYSQADWLRNGGNDTLNSYPDRQIPQDHMNFYRSLVFFYETETHFFCHAGVHPYYPLDEQSPNDLLWIRQTFLYSDKDFGKIVVHGHTPQDLENPVVRPNRINIDQGCVFGGRLTAVVLEDKHEPKFVQVQSNYSWKKGFIMKPLQ